jgi:antirestriction protein ArdC
MAKTSRRLSDAERAERRARDRDRLRQATEALLSSEGWQRWVRARATFHHYSMSNTLLLAHQCAARGITPTHVAGFRAWLSLGRAVRRGESALWVIAPMAVRRRDQRGEDTGEKRMFFRSVPVFELSQTDPIDGVDQAPLEPPSAPIEGDSHRQLLEPLSVLAHELGYTLDCAELDGACGGYCAYRAKRIVIEERQPPNAKVRVAVHELAHALGASSNNHGRERCEVIVECAAFIVCSGLGLATGGESIPYIAGWGEDGALEAITEAAELIDQIASRIETAVGLRNSAAATEAADDAITASV